MRKSKLAIFFIIVTVLVLANNNTVLADSELSEDVYFEMVDPIGTVIHQTSHILDIGDQFINEDNNIYEVKRIEAYKAFVEKVGDFNPGEFDVSTEAPQSNWYDNFLAVLSKNEKVVAVQKDGNKPLVALYHTHDDESYKPTEGYASASKGNGGILKVGDKFAQALENKGINISHDKTSHYPHDAMAYDRSRRTATQLIKQAPAAIFDIHRDAVPANVYALKKDGKDLTKVTIVLGRQNPNIKANEAFAKKLKTIADKNSPGLIKGILYAKGKYNQDMSPKMLLLEIGAHTNSREAAERGVTLLADSIPQLVGSTQPGAPSGGTTTPGESKGIGKALGWLIGLTILGGGAFLLLNSGSLGEVSSRIKRLGRTELASYLGKEENNRSNPQEKKQDDSTNDK